MNSDQPRRLNLQRRTAINACAEIGATSSLADGAAEEQVR